MVTPCLFKVPSSCLTSQFADAPTHSIDRIWRTHRVSNGWSVFGYWLRYICSCIQKPDASSGTESGHVRHSDVSDCDLHAYENTCLQSETEQSIRAPSRIRACPAPPPIVWEELQTRLTLILNPCGASQRIANQDPRCVVEHEKPMREIANHQSLI